MKTGFPHRLFVLALSCCIVFGCPRGVRAGQDAASMIADTLKCEYQVNPMGLDVHRPRLSWTLASDLRGQTQTAYHVIVSADLQGIEANRGDQWDSGKVTSKESIQVVYQGAPLKSGTRYFWKVRVWNKNGHASPWSKASWFETALLTPGEWQATWINDGKANPAADEDFYKFDPAPLFRKEFVLAKPMKQARLYITGLGYYEASLNGRRIGDHRLDPGWTKYTERVYYSTYDVTGQVRNGDNCLGVTLGNGWYNPMPLRMWGHKNLRENVPIGRPRFVSQLHIQYEDGSAEWIVSNEDWKVSQGPILRNSIYLGEIYDARKEIPGWDEPGFDDSAWPRAALATEPMGPLQAQPLAPMKVTATVKPVKISEPQKGVYIVDMGQNFSGWASFKFDAAPGTQVTLRYGELLHEDGTLNPMTSVCGQIKGKPNNALEAHPGLAVQRDVYFARGEGPEHYTPRFTFHAFRYIEITGYPVRPTLDMITGLRLNSEVQPVGHFSCSNEMFNAIQTLCDWTFLSNIFSVQSDCPHRERFGYGGDLVNTNEAFMMNYDMSNFYAKAVTDWDDSKLEDGMLTDTAPSVGIQYCGVGWAMAHPHTQLKLYQYYGDKRIIEQQYPTSRQWLDLVTKSTPTHIIKNGLSDHESLAEKPAPPMVTPLYYQSANILGQLASILGYQEQAATYRALAANIKTAYQANFFDAETGQCSPGTQASQSFALFSNILPDANRAAALTCLLDDIGEHDGHLTTGIFGTRYMLELLSQHGHIQTAYDMVNQTTFPSWGHMLENGATTLWEHWAFSDNTFSHNHPMFGSVSQWFYNWLGGIQPHPEAVGFDRIIIRPQIPRDLSWVHCSYESIRGSITSHWHKIDQTLVMDIVIPANTVATVYVPCTRPDTIREGSLPAGQAPGVEFERREDNASLYRVQSGQYHFVMPYKTTE
ncbi:MAG: glycoside hydrolase family 78 protein [Phycisphaerae bacterium]|nr:glycoside hydrolase family 78 protein [Phycisphaerae bacterium]